MKLAYAILSDTLGSLAPIAAAALGALATEYVGVLNIALEGLIMLGAFVFIAVGSLLGPVWGFLAALTLTSMAAWAQDAFSRRAKADAFVAGLAVNLLIPAAASLVSQRAFGTKGVVPMGQLLSLRMPAYLFELRYSDVLAFSVAGFIAVVLAATPFGIRARALGMKPGSLQIAGISLSSVRARAYVLSGLGCAAAGVAMAASVGAWIPYISSGRGWIALVAVYLGGKRLFGTIIASLAFALLSSLANQAQALPRMPADLLASLPYLVTAVAVLVGAAYKTRH